MTPRSLLSLLLASLALASTGAQAAASGVPVSPVKVSVVAGESRLFEARFYDAAGQPSVGETVQFANDACGRFSPSGLFFMNAVTDANGVARANFTALTTGSIGCHVQAQAGAVVRFDVLTYPLSNAYLGTATLNPPEPRPGQPFRIEVNPKVGIYDLYNVDVTASVIPGMASATITPSSANSGQEGIVGFDVTPDGRMGGYLIELDYRGAKRTVTMAAPANPWQDLWWSGMAENGWGMSVVQHRDVLFSIVYAYDDTGNPIWYVMPSGEWNAARTAFNGPVYIPRGSPYSAYDVSRFDVGAPVGTMTLTFGNQADRASLDYTINGLSGHKAIQRIPYSEGGTSPQKGVGDLWWGGMTQNGWGLAVLQSGRTLFSLWFTYDENGTATWFVMPGGFWSDSHTYQGRLFRATGSPWLGRDYDASVHRTTDVGAYQIAFAEDGTATFRYNITGGAGGALPLTRIPF